METSRNSQWLSEMPMNLATKIANKFKQADMIYQATTSEGVRTFRDAGKCWPSSEWAERIDAQDRERAEYLNWILRIDPLNKYGRGWTGMSKKTLETITKLRKINSKQRLTPSTLIFHCVYFSGFQK